MKRLFLMTSLLLTSGLTILSCSSKDQNPKPKDPWYFSFEADGVPYKYEYEVSHSFTGSRSNMGGFQSTTTAWGGTYQIYAYSNEDPVARGEFRFFLNKEDFNNLDTIVLDGRRNKIAIYDFENSSTSYSMQFPLNGKLIFTERTDTSLKGNFEFTAYKLRHEDGRNVLTDTVLKITQGEFLVGRVK